MGNLLLRIFLAVSAFIVIVLLIGTMMSRNFDMSTSVEINAPPEKVFPHINEMKRWSKWTMWSPNRISDLTVEYSGEASGKGAIQEWTEHRGKGKLWITESIENEKVGFTSSFTKFPDMHSEITLTPTEGGGAKVTWASQGALPSGPFYGWFGMTFSDSLRNEYSKSLTLLKQLCE